MYDRQRTLQLLMYMCPDVNECAASLISMHACVCVFLQNLTSKDKEYVNRLTLSNVTEADAGQYWCTGSNFLGKSEIPFWLAVRQPGKSPSPNTLE